MDLQAVEPVTQPAAYTGIKPFRVSSVLRKHTQWANIHADIATSHLTPIEICQKYEIKWTTGKYAVVPVVAYRANLFEQHKDLFAKARELELGILQGEVVSKFRSVFDKADAGHELATKASDFEAMGAMQSNMLAATDRMAAVVTGAQKKNDTPNTVNHTQILNVMALPKQEGVPQRTIQPRP